MNTNKSIVKDKYTVENFCKKYNETNIEKSKEALIEKVMNPHYVSYEMKITICEKIIESSYYKKEEKDGIKTRKLHINSPVEYMLYCLYLVKQYTNIEVDFSKLPCSKCERRYHPTCPKPDCWNKDGKYMVY